MKITKSQLQRVVKEELAALKKEGYGAALDRERSEERRQKSRDYDARERERERNQRSGGYRSPGAHSGMGGIGGGGSGKKRFAGFNRDDESADHREDHNIDDLWAMVRDLEAKVKDLKGK